MKPDPRRVAFGNRVRALRSKRGFSQEGFAHHIDMDRTYISGIERGKRNPTLDVILRIADGLEIEPITLFTSWATTPDSPR